MKTLKERAVEISKAVKNNKSVDMEKIFLGIDNAIIEAAENGKTKMKIRFCKKGFELGSIDTHNITVDDISGFAEMHKHIVEHYLAEDFNVYKQDMFGGLFYSILIDWTN